MEITVCSMILPAEGRGEDAELVGLGSDARGRGVHVHEVSGRATVLASGSGHQDGEHERGGDGGPGKRHGRIDRR
jgi:hypothetical protein